MGNWTTQERDGVAVLAFARPPENFVDFGSLIELGDRLEAFAAGPAATRVVVLTGGVPGMFVNHADLSDLARIGSGAATPAELGAWSRALRLLEEIPQPTVAAIDGLASGGGNELALACTIRIGSERARLQQPEVTAGLIPGGGGSVRLPRLTGPAVAADAILTGRAYGAAEALRVGWLTQVLPAEDFLESVMAYARDMAAAPAAALVAAKTSIVGGSRMPFADAQQQERALFGRLAATLRPTS
jgi:enoyl-CoA hydratase